MKDSRRDLGGDSLGLQVKFWLGKEYRDFVEGHDYPGQCWAICDSRTDGLYHFALKTDGRGRFNSKREAERAMSVLAESGIKSGEDVKRIGADAFFKLIYRDLFW